MDSTEHEPDSIYVSCYFYLMPTLICAKVLVCMYMYVCVSYILIFLPRNSHSPRTFLSQRRKKMEEMSTSSTVLPPPPPFLILLALVIYTVDQGIEHCPQHACMPLYGEAVTFSSLCIL